MNLAQRVAQAFDATGPLADQVEAFRSRTGQLEMAGAVADVMETGGQLVVEAGTGVGKTFAYLVPALLSGRRVLLSTASKALQDQLFGRDIPQLMNLLGLALRVRMLKGRSSYLCLERAARARQELRFDERRDSPLLARIETWAHATRTGDLAEVSALDDDAPILPLVTSTRENCLGAGCPQAASCFVNQARREALAADVVVINHHLFFADLRIRESGVAELLPSVHAVVFDEAHQLNEIGVQFLGQQLSTAQLSGLGRDVATWALAQARAYAPWEMLLDALTGAAEALLHRFPASESVLRMDWSVLGSGGQTQLERTVQALEALQQALASVAEISPELRLLESRASDLLLALNTFAQPLETGSVRWLELGRQLRLLQAPLHISQVMQTRLFGAEGSAAKSWIFTSATLGHDAGLSWFVDSCGLSGARVLQVASPFDYASQAALYVPPVFVQPADAQHSLAVAALVRQGAAALRGRTLVLTTTLRAMRSIGAQLRAEPPGREGMQILVQGEMTKRALLARFCQAAQVDGAGAVLVASASFWEGIDIPGEALQLVVIDKLPFTPPDDPLQQGRAQALEVQGKNAFKHLHLPQAAVALKQGAGRLIRRETDQGLLVICDVRLTQKGYGRQLLAALPPMQRLKTPEEFSARLDQITRSATREFPGSALL
jgi:ATP-dependent DNA helicase DinG